MSVEDRLAIQDLAYYYAYYIDIFDVDSWVNVFTPDAFFDEREFGSGLHVGHDAIRAYGNSIVDTTAHAVHLMTNHLIRDLTLESARGTVFGLVEGMKKTGRRLRQQVRYEDEYVKLDGEWKIAKRILRKTFPPESVMTFIKE